jgi:hypothetical protein
MYRERQRPFLLPLALSFQVRTGDVPEVVRAVFIGHHKYCYLRIIFDRVYAI